MVIEVFFRRGERVRSVQFVKGGTGETSHRYGRVAWVTNDVDDMRETGIDGRRGFIPRRMTRRMGRPANVAVEVFNRPLIDIQNGRKTAQRLDAYEVDLFDIADPEVNAGERLCNAIILDVLAYHNAGFFEALPKQIV